MTNLQIANEVAKKVGAAEAGVCIYTAYIDGAEYYVIWTIVAGEIKDHSLLCSTTDRVRLQLHVEGFIENLNKK